MGIQGPGFRVQGSGFRVQGSGRVPDHHGEDEVTLLLAHDHSVPQPFRKPALQYLSLLIGGFPRLTDRTQSGTAAQEK